jgi:DNA-binding FadR family transcriptional regulator
MSRILSHKTVHIKIIEHHGQSLNAIFLREAADADTGTRRHGEKPGQDLQDLQDCKINMDNEKAVWPESG